MATFPCSFGAHRYPGAQRSAYISLIASRDPQTRKHRLCKKHYEEVERICMQHLQDVTDEGQMSYICEWEGCQQAREYTLSCRLYPGSESEIQYAGDFCAAHGKAAVGSLGWEYAIPLGER